MTMFNWQIETPIEAIVFDCDGTLSMLEGIDELARNNGMGEAVESMTAEAMTRLGINLDLYDKRLNLVRPGSEQVLALGQQYLQHQVPDVGNVITLLNRLNKHIYLVSAGLHPSVAFFGEQLQIPQQNIYAVKIHFDKNGNYCDFDRESPLVASEGKRKIISELKNRHRTIVHVGDGLNDYVVYDLVTRFIGFGGVFFRENIAAKCEYYIKAMSMAPLLPLVLTKNECLELKNEELELYQKGLTAIHDKHVLINI